MRYVRASRRPDASRNGTRSLAQDIAPSGPIRASRPLGLASGKRSDPQGDADDAGPFGRLAVGSIEDRTAPGLLGPQSI